jgi:uncharacterized membrane protein
MTLAGTPAGTQPRIAGVPENESGIRKVNIGDTERLISIIAGIPATIFGLTRGLGGVIPAALGGLLIYRGVSGHSFLYDALGVNTLGKSPAAVSELPNGQGIQVKRAVTILSSPQDLYSQWHDFETAPMYMWNVESVQSAGGNRWRWVAKVPPGITVEWEAEVTGDAPGSLIAWRTVQGSFFAPSAGSVRFEPKRNGRETVVRLEIEFRQFRGPIGTLLGDVLGQIPEQLARQDLERFKELMEAGEIATTKGQPSGRQSRNKEA